MFLLLTWERWSERKCKTCVTSEMERKDEKTQFSLPCLTNERELFLSREKEKGGGELEGGFFLPPLSEKKLRLISFFLFFPHLKLHIVNHKERFESGFECVKCLVTSRHTTMPIYDDVGMDWAEEWEVFFTCTIVDGNFHEFYWNKAPTRCGDRVGVVSAQFVSFSSLILLNENGYKGEEAKILPVGSGSVRNSQRNALENFSIVCFWLIEKKLLLFSLLAWRNLSKCWAKVCCWWCCCFMTSVENGYACVRCECEEEKKSFRNNNIKKRQQQQRLSRRVDGEKFTWVSSVSHQQLNESKA